MDSASLLLHPAFGTPADLTLTRGPSIFNKSAFGLRAKWQSADRAVYAMGALLDGIPDDPAHPKRTAILFDKGDGSFVIAELGWMPDERGHLFEPIEALGGLPAAVPGGQDKYNGVSKYAAGLWRYGNRLADQCDMDASGAPRRRRPAPIRRPWKQRSKSPGVRRLLPGSRCNRPCNRYVIRAAEPVRPAPRYLVFASRSPCRPTSTRPPT